MNCKKCPIKEECDIWFKAYKKKRPSSKRKGFCPLINGAIRGIINLLGQEETLDILLSEFEE